MGRIIIIDNNHARRKALREALQSIARGRETSDYASINDEIESGQLERGCVIFLHVGAAQGQDTMQTLKGRYQEVLVFCYSGGVEAAADYKAHQRQYKNHYWYDQIVENTIGEKVKKGLMAFLTSLEKGEREDIARQLHTIDLIKEAKLEVLSLIASGKSLTAIQGTQSYNKLNGEGLLEREDVEKALSSLDNLHALRVRWFPE